jgi:hypothetical protein
MKLYLDDARASARFFRLDEQAVPPTVSSTETPTEQAFDEMTFNNVTLAAQPVSMESIRIGVERVRQYERLRCWLERLGDPRIRRQTSGRLGDA